jgi:hypothetical protein
MNTSACGHAEPRNRFVSVGSAGLAGVLALTIGSSAQSRHAIQREETISRTLRFGGGTDRILEVSTISGAIRVAGHDDDAVEVVIRKTVRAESEADAAAAETAVGLEISEAADAIRLRGSVEAQPGCDWETVTRRRGRPPYEVTFDFDLRVPRNTRLRLCTVNNGAVHVTGTTSDFEIDNVNGAITPTEVSGSGRAVTVNGGVTATFTEAPKAALLFKSINGDLDVVFPRTLSADLLMKTFNGGLFTDYDVSPLPIAAAAVERRQGMSVYRGDRFSGFRVGRGGPTLTFDAFNGNVRVVAGQ